MYRKLYPTLLFSFILLPSPFWGPAHQGIQFLASAGSWGMGVAMAWQHQACFFAGRACTFQHAQLGALQQKPLLGKKSKWGPYSPGSRPNILGSCGEPNRAQMTVKSPSKVPEKNLDDVFTLYFKCIWGVLTMNHTSIDGCVSN
jgi:hypothetical protein